MTRKLFLGLLAVSVMSLWYVGCTKDDGPVPVDEHPPVLERLDVAPDEMVCGSFDIIGNVTDIAEAELDPTGVDKIWVTLDGVEIESLEPGTNCEVSVEFAFTNIEIDGPGLLALHAKDCEGNEKILHQVDIDAVFDGDPPTVTFTTPTEGATLYGSTFLIEVDVDSDDDNVTAYLEIDGFDYAPDSNAPYRWSVELEEGPHLANARVMDSCGNEGMAEVSFDTDVCADNTPPEVVITDPGDIECMPHDIMASVTDSEARELIDVWAEINGVEIEGMPHTGDTWRFRVRDGLINGTNLVTVYANDGCGNIGEDEVTVTYSCPDCVPMITAPVENELLCGDFTFMAEVENCDRELPTIDEVCFYFDGAQSYAYCDQDGSDGWGYTTDVSLGLEPGNHYVVAKATLVDLDGNETIQTSSAVNFIVSCPPTAVIEPKDQNGDGVWVDPCAGIIEVTGEYSYDDNTEPGLLYTFTSPTCAFELTQSSPIDPDVTLDFSANFCGFGDYVIILTVDDQWGWTDSDTLIVSMDNPAPVITGLAEENSDGGYYANFLSDVPFSLLYTDAVVCECTTYEIYWEIYNEADELIYSDSDVDLDMITYDFPALGNYRVCAYIVETVMMGDPCTVPFVLTSETVCWDICLEATDPIITSFDVQNLIFGEDEGPYCNPYINENTNLVSNEVPTGEGSAAADSILFVADDNYDTDGCVSGCDYLLIEGTHATADPITISTPFINCGDVGYDVDWDDFAAGEWLITFTIFDKAGNSASESETVIKSNFPVITPPTAGMYTNQYEGVWACYEDPIGVKIHYGDWFGTDDNGMQVDSLVFEYIWDRTYISGPDDGTCHDHRSHLQELWGYDPNTFEWPYEDYVPDYGHHWVRIWACDQYEMWSRSMWMKVEASDHCDPDWEFNLNIDSVDGFNVDPHIADWDRVDVFSANDIQFCLDEMIYDREAIFNDHGIDRVYFVPFNVDDGFDVDGNGTVEGSELTYWTGNYGVLPGDGSLGEGTTACVPPGNGTIPFIDDPDADHEDLDGQPNFIYLAKIASDTGGNFTATCTGTNFTWNDFSWDAKNSPWYGCCGFYYVYAIAQDENGNFSAPSDPIVIFKYDTPSLTAVDCIIGEVGEDVLLVEFELEFECPDEIESITYSWDFDDGSAIEETDGPTTTHAWTAPGLYEVECTVTVVDATGVHTDTAVTCISIGDTDEPAITNLDINEDHANNANKCNEGWYNAQYGLMNYQVSAEDVGGILQGPEDINGNPTWTVEVSLWTDDDGAQYGDDPGSQIMVIAELLNPTCCENEKEWYFSFNWTPDGDYGYLERGWYWMRARVFDRSGNYMGQDTVDEADDYFSLQLFHSDKPVINVLETCDYEDMNTLRFNIRYDCLDMWDDAPLSIHTKTQWDQTMPTNINNWTAYEYGTLHCPDCPRCTDGTPYGPTEFVFDHEFDWTDDQDIDNVWFDYYESGDGYGTYKDNNAHHTNPDGDNPAVVRMVDEDGIYSDLNWFEVEIEDISEPCIEWQEPICEVVTGETDLIVWASDYPEFDNRGDMPCIDRVDFFINGFYAGTDDAGEELDDGVHELCGVDTDDIWVFMLEDFDISAFLDEQYGIDPDADCGWGGEIELHARAWDCDDPNSDQTGDAFVTVCESNVPVLVNPAPDCEWAFNEYDDVNDEYPVELDFTPYFCDDNALRHIVINWGDGSDPETVLWANADAVTHEYETVGCYEIEVDVYDEYSVENACCPGSNAGPYLEEAAVGSVLIDLNAPIVLKEDMLPLFEATCVSVDPGSDIEIIVGDIADGDSEACFGKAQIDWVKFWLSDDNWTNKEYLGIDEIGDEGTWSAFWNPWNQEAKQVWIGIEIMDCAGNSAEYFMEEDAGEYWFFKDLKPWDVTIDHHEVWALLNPNGAADIPFEGAANNDPGHNEPDDETIYSWFWPSDACDDPTYPKLPDTDGEEIDVNGADDGLAPGDYWLYLAAEDDCFTYCDEANFDSTLIHYCDEDEGPVIDWLDGIAPDDPVVDATFLECITVDDCFFWEDGLWQVIASGGEVMYEGVFQSQNQWNSDWPEYYTYADPGDAEEFCIEFDLGNETCVWVDVDGDTLTYNPFADGETFTLHVEATDYHPSSPNTTVFDTVFEVDDVLGPYVNPEGFWYGDDYIFGDDELALSGASIDFEYNGGNAVISVDAIDWHCSKIGKCVFVFEEPAANWIYVDEDNIFGIDTDPSDGLSADLSLPVPSDDSYKVGVFLWDEHGNISLQSSVRFYSTGTLVD